LNDDVNENVSLFPSFEYRSEKWLRMLRELGLSQNLNPDIYIRSARRAEEAQDVERSRKLLRHLSDDFSTNQRTLTSDAEFMRTISTIHFIPASKDGVTIFTSFQKLAIDADRALCWTSTPILRKEDEPPRLMWSSLGIQSPPDITKSLAHLSTLSRSRGDYESAFQSVESYGIGVLMTFDQLYTRLTETWSKLSPRVQAALPTMSIVPVLTSEDDGNWNNFMLLSPTSRRVFFELSPELKEKMSSLVYELPKALSKHSNFLKSKLGIAVSPGAKEYSALLEGLSLMRNRLNPNQINAALRLIDLISREGSDDIKSYIPDDNGKLRAAYDLVFDDDPDLRRLIETSTGRRIICAHPRVSKLSCATLSVALLSQTARQEVVNAVDDNDNVLETLKSTIQSAAFTDEVVQICDEYIAYDQISDDIDASRGTHIRNALQALNIIQKKTIEIKVVLPGRYIMNHESNHTFETPPVSKWAFLHKNNLFVRRCLSNDEDRRNFFMDVAISIRTYLKLPRAIIYGITSLLSTSGEIFVGPRIHQKHRILALTRGSPGSQVDTDDVSNLQIAPVHKFSIGEIVATKDSDGTLRYAKVLEVPTYNTRVVPRLALDTGHSREEILSTEIYVFKAHMETSSTSSRIERQPPSSDSDGWCEEKHDLIHSRPNEDERCDLLSAVDDLLRRAALPPLDTDRRSLLKNLEETKAKLADLEAVRNQLKPKEPLPEFICPITLSIMKEPVIAADGNSYEKTAIERWLATRGTSPLTNARLETRTLFPNRALQRAIARFRGEDDIAFT